MLCLCSCTRSEMCGFWTSMYLLIFFPLRFGQIYPNDTHNRCKICDIFFFTVFHVFSYDFDFFVDLIFSTNTKLPHSTARAFGPRTHLVWRQINWSIHNYWWCGLSISVLVLRRVQMSVFLMPEMMTHIYIQDIFFNHRVQLIKIIIKYIKLRLIYYAKKSIDPNRIKEITSLNSF